ncbi:MAG TPA: hypothetical protein VF681_06750 [Abditibacteriaceae bacterium]|jgi:hypothetical protein
MRHAFSTLNFRNRPFLLLLLLPYLVVSVLAAGHTHGFSASNAGHSVAAHSQALCVAESGAESVATPSASIADDSSTHGCLACSWSGLGAAIVSPALSVRAPLAVSTSSLLSRTFVVSGVPLLRRTRGPPAS